MTPPELTLGEQMEQSQAWLSRDAETFECQVFKSSGVDTYLVSAGTLAGAHPCLPGALRALIAHYQAIHPAFTAAGLHVRKTFELLKHGVVGLTSTNGQDCVLSEVFDVSYTGTNVDPVEIQADRVYTKKVRVENQDVHLALSSFKEKIQVSRIELANKYPGWKEKWEIGMELGIPIHDLQRLVFFDLAKRSLIEPVDSLKFE